MDIAQNESLIDELHAEEDLTTEENLENLYESAKNGDADAMLKIAQIYIACARDEKDYKKAYEWAIDAKEQGKVEALFLLGEMYQFGAGCEKNEKKAISFYKKAARKGLKSAEDKLKALKAKHPEEKAERNFVLLYAVVSVIVSIIAVYVIIQKCSGPANHLVDSVIHKALTVQDADAVEADGSTIADGIMPMNGELAEYGKYHFITEEELQNEGYTVCPIMEATATSEQIADVGAQYGIQNTYDGKLYTNWQEAEDDAGIGQSLTYTFREQMTIKAIGIYLGNGRSEKAYAENNRPEMLTFKAGSQELPCYFTDENGMRYIALDEPIVTDKISLTIDSVYQGKSTKNLTCITEITFYQ